MRDDFAPDIAPEGRRHTAERIGLQPDVFDSIDHALDYHGHKDVPPNAPIRTRYEAFLKKAEGGYALRRDLSFPYIRKRGEGELAVRAAFADSTMVRSAVMFGADAILKLLQRLPAFPMFGRGQTRLQPAFVEDVAEAIVRVIQRDEARAKTFECGGPDVYSYQELLRTIAREARLTLKLVPVPFPVWHALAWVAEFLPTPLVTRNQVELMQRDNVPSPGMP